MYQEFENQLYTIVTIHGMNVLKQIAHRKTCAWLTYTYHIRYNNHPISRYTRVQLFAKVRLYKYTLKTLVVLLNRFVGLHPVSQLCCRRHGRTYFYAAV